MFVYRVFSKFGDDGRYAVLRSVRPGHVKRWCETVSSEQSQSGQSGEMSGLILCRCEFSGMCWVRSLKTMACSGLAREFKASFGFGVAICLNTLLPVVPIAHSISHCSLLFLLIMFFAVCSEAGLSICTSVAPLFASVSALSFPCMSVCPGIHCKVRSTS